MRVQDLERLLKEHGIETGADGSNGDSQRDNLESKADRKSSDHAVEIPETQREVPDDPRDLSRDHLVSPPKTIWRSEEIQQRLSFRSSAKMVICIYMDPHRRSDI